MGTVKDPPVQGGDDQMLAQVARIPHVVARGQPVLPADAVEVSRDGKTAFAAINYDKPANLVPDAAGKPVLDQSRRFMSRA